MIERSHFITQQLIEKGNVKSVVVACNTATAVAIESLRQKFVDLPFVGVEPALKPAIQISKTGRVGVIGTHGTLQSVRFEKLLRKVQADAAPGACEFIIQPCQGLALAIEKQTEKLMTDTSEVEQLCLQYLKAMGTFGHAAGQIDTLVLGCTHYVFVEDILQRLLGRHVNIISTGSAVARQAHRLSANSMSDTQFDSIEKSISAPRYEASNGIQLWTTGSLGALQHAADRWLNLSSHCCHWIEPSGH